MAKGKGSFGGNNSFMNNLGFNLIGGVVGVNNCDSEDKDWYCSLSRIFSTIIMVITILFILYIIYNLIKIFILTSKKSKRR
jgi:hypothetical protein